MAIFGAEALEFATGLDLSGLDRDLKKGVTKFNSAGAKFSKALAPVAAGIAAVGAAIGAMGLALGKGAVETGAEFEALETRLGTLMKSAEAGAARMNTIFDFASSTPFELTELVEAEVVLRSLGADAERAMPLLIDFAGAMGGDIAGAALDMGRALQFGAGAVQSGLGMSLRSAVTTRTGIDALTMSVEQFREAVIATLGDEDGMFAGGADKLAQTFSGMVSNLQDQWTGFQKQTADAGIFAAVKASLGVTLELIQENERGISRIAETVSGGLVGALKAGITVVGFLLDSFTGAKFLAAEVSRVAWGITKALVEGALAAVNLLRVMELTPGIGAAIGAGLDVIETGLSVTNEALGIAVNEATLVGDAAAAAFGEGAAAAVRYKDAIDEAVEAAKQLPAEFASAEGAGGASGSKSKEAEDALNRLRGIERDATMATLSEGQRLFEMREEQLRQIQKYTALSGDLAAGRSAAAAVELEYAKSVSDSSRELQESIAKLEKAGMDESIRQIESYISTAMGLWGDFASARVAGEETMGESLKRIGFGFLGEQLLGVAKWMGLVAAAYFAVGNPVKGALYTAGAAVAVAGAAAMNGLASGAIGGGARQETVAARSSGSSSSGTANPDASGGSAGERSASASSARTSGGSTTVRISYGHREFAAITADSLQIPGSPIGDALRASRVAGQRVT